MSNICLYFLSPSNHRPFSIVCHSVFLIPSFLLPPFSSSVALATSSVSFLELNSHEHYIQGLSEDQAHLVTDPEYNPALTLSVAKFGDNKNIGCHSHPFPLRKAFLLQRVEIPSENRILIASPKASALDPPLGSHDFNLRHIEEKVVFRAVS